MTFRGPKVFFTALALFSAVSACGGANSRLVTVRAGSGSGPIDFTVKNATDAPVNALYLAKTERVTAADQRGFDTIEGQQLWGPDRLSRSAIGTGQGVKIELPEAGEWDVRAVDRDDRYQHVTGLRLRAGGRYILELNEGGWRVK